MLGAHIARRLKYIHLLTHTQTLTHTHKPGLSLTGRIHQHVESQMHIKPPPRGAAPLSPGSAAWRSARRLPLSCGRGNYPSFCVCVRKHRCVWFAFECDAFTGTIFHICFLLWHRASQPTSQVAGVALFFPEAPEQGSEAAAAGRRLREEQSEEGRNSQTAAL